jgi:hypothetical protein
MGIGWLLPLKTPKSRAHALRRIASPTPPQVGLAYPLGFHGWEDEVDAIRIRVIT